MEFPQTYQELIDGWVFIVDKPLEWTSFDVVNKFKSHLKNLKKIQSEELKTRNVKVGHAGTLDPLATGLLVVCVGKKTKEIDQYQGGIKTYTGTITLGKTTPSYDLETQPEGDFPFAHLTQSELEQNAQSFIGEQWQTPPAFSAKQINGKRAYEFAREGIEINLKKSLIEVLSFKITQYELPNIEFEITCSKGTYIRTIAHEFGQRLNSGSYLSSLRRTNSAPFDLSTAHSMEEINAFFKKWTFFEK
jgi:tRNA pseudouridine55 synthase